MENHIYVKNKNLIGELKAQNFDFFNQKHTHHSFSNIFYIATKIGYIAKYNSLIYKKTKEIDRDELFQLLMESVKRPRKS